jgi:hypothetical protein
MDDHHFNYITKNDVFLNGQNMGKQLQQIRFPQNFMICFFKKKILIENICLYF